MWSILIATILAGVIGISIIFCIRYCCSRKTKKKITSKERQKIENDQESWITQIDSDEDVEQALDIDGMEEKSSFLEPRKDFEDENHYEICVPEHIVIVLQLQDTNNKVELQPGSFENNLDFEPNQDVEIGRGPVKLGIDANPAPKVASLPDTFLYDPRNNTIKNVKTDIEKKKKGHKHEISSHFGHHRSHHLKKHTKIPEENSKINVEDPEDNHFQNIYEELPSKFNETSVSDQSLASASLETSTETLIPSEEFVEENDASSEERRNNEHFVRSSDEPNSHSYENSITDAENFENSSNQSEQSLAATSFLSTSTETLIPSSEEVIDENYDASVETKRNDKYLETSEKQKPLMTDETSSDEYFETSSTNEIVQEKESSELESEESSPATSSSTTTWSSTSVTFSTSSRTSSSTSSSSYVTASSSTTTS